MKILTINLFKPKNGQKYDIEVADNHNFFVKDVLVSNSNARFMIKNGEIIFGSHHTIMDSEMEENKRWKRHTHYIREKLKGIDLYPYEGMIFYGEYCILHTVHYDFTNMPLFIGFDIYKLDGIGNYRWVDPIIAQTIFIDLGFTFVPIIGIFRAKDIRTTKHPHPVIESMKIELPAIEGVHLPLISKYSTEEAEGMVFKNYRTGVFGKYVTANFRNKNKKVFGKTKAEADDDTERIAIQYCTYHRVQNMIYKLMDEGELLGMPMMKYLPIRVLEDMFHEEWMKIFGIPLKKIPVDTPQKETMGAILGLVLSRANKSINFKRLRKLVAQRSKMILETTITANVKRSEE